MVTETLDYMVLVFGVPKARSGMSVSPAKS